MGTFHQAAVPVLDPLGGEELRSPDSGGSCHDGQVVGHPSRCFTRAWIDLRGGDVGQGRANALDGGRRDSLSPQEQASQRRPPGRQRIGHAAG